VVLPDDFLQLAFSKGFACQILGLGKAVGVHQESVTRSERQCADRKIGLGVEELTRMFLRYLGVVTTDIAISPMPSGPQ